MFLSSKELVRLSGRLIERFEHFCPFLGMRAFFLFECVLLCFVCSRRSVGGRVPPFLCLSDRPWPEERFFFFFTSVRDFSRHRLSSAGDGSRWARSHVTCVSNP